VWEQTSLPRRPFAYPASAPPLAAGTRYAWSVEAGGQPVQRAEFEVVEASEAARILAMVAELSPGPVASGGGTAALLRAGLFVQLAAIAADPDEPTLHQLLGQVYAATGLNELAAQELDEAEFLARPR
jgi:hypothetical protein